MADFLPWFPFDFDAFMEGTPGWTWDERGAYLTLLREQWRAGFIPNAPDRLHLFIAGASKSGFRRMWRERIAAKFDEVPGEPGRLINARMAAERDQEVVIKAVRARAGAAGAAAVNARRGGKGSAVAAPEGAEEAGNGAANAAGLPDETAGKNPANAEHRSHDSNSLDPKSDRAESTTAPMRVISDSTRPDPGPVKPPWNVEVFRAIWTAAKLGVGINADGWQEAEILVSKISDTAAARGEAPEELAAKLLRAWPAMCEAWGKRNRAPRGRGPGKLNAHFGAVVEWLDGGGRETPQPMAPTRGPAPVSSQFTHGKELT